MIVDTSALVAVARLEPEAHAIATTLTMAAEALIPAPTFVELCAVIKAPISDVRDLLGRFNVRVEPFDEAAARAAAAAYRTYGKGSGHPAQLNLGDALVAGLAISRGESVLFKGDDFAHVPEITPA